MELELDPACMCCPVGTAQICMSCSVGTSQIGCVSGVQRLQVRSSMYQLFGGHKLDVSAVSEYKLDLACIRSSVGTSQIRHISGVQWGQIHPISSVQWMQLRYGICISCSVDISQIQCVSAVWCYQLDLALSAFSLVQGRSGMYPSVGTSQILSLIHI